MSAGATPSALPNDSNRRQIGQLGSPIPREDRAAAVLQAADELEALRGRLDAYMQTARQTYRQGLALTSELQRISRTIEGIASGRLRRK